MTTTPLAGRALQPDTIRQALTATGRTHPMDLCEWCGKPAPDTQADCADPICQALWQQLLDAMDRASQDTEPEEDR